MAITPNVDTASVVLTGMQPLLLDNIEHADPKDPIAREVKKITDKGKEMTDQDRSRKDFLAYQASLYLKKNPDGGEYVVVPWRCLFRALRTGAFKIGGVSASGKVDGGINCAELDFRLNYEGPSADKLYEDSRFIFRTMVNKNPTGKKAMVPSERPIFPEWTISFNLIIFNEVIGWDLFERILSMTGLAVGIGNGRKLGYGKFTAEVTKL